MQGRFWRFVAAAVLVNVAVAAPAEQQIKPVVEQVGEEVRFITCPIYRDTDAGRKSGCWLGDRRETGTRFDITGSPTKPDWNHAVLVEGRVVEGDTQQCGGVLLEPVRVSVLHDQNCTRHMLPAEGFTGRRFSLPTRNIRPLYEPRELPKPPYQEKSFDIPFDFGRDYIVYQLSDYYIDKAVKYAIDIDASRVEITGYAATTPTTVSGQTLGEPAELALRRAEVAREWLRRMGYPLDRVKIRAQTKAKVSDMEGADGLTEPSRRRVTLRVIP